LVEIKSPLICERYKAETLFLPFFVSISFDMIIYLVSLNKNASTIKLRRNVFKVMNKLFPTGFFDFFLSHS